MMNRRSIEECLNKYDVEDLNQRYKEAELNMVISNFTKYPEVRYSENMKKRMINEAKRKIGVSTIWDPCIHFKQKCLKITYRVGVSSVSNFTFIALKYKMQANVRAFALGGGSCLPLDTCMPINQSHLSWSLMHVPAQDRESQ